jgi:hypothetical protein
MRENIIENYLIAQWTKRTRGECIKLSPEHYAGIPDRMCLCAPGWTIYVELKAPTGRESKLQPIVHKKWRARGHWVECLYTKEAIDKFIDIVCELIIKQTPTKTKG